MMTTTTTTMNKTTAQCISYPHPWGENPELPFGVMVLDPRPASREAMLEKLRSASSVYGVEVTIPEFAELCEVNLDHHGANDTIHTPAACEQALHAELPKQGALVVTVRPDSDSVVAMAVLAWRAMGKGAHLTERLVKLVSKFDRFGPHFTDDRTKLAKAMDKEYLSALGQVAAESQMSLAFRVRWVMDWVTCQMDEDHVYQLAEKREQELEEARRASETTVIDGKIAVVVSTHRFATTLGYEMADIVVALNPEMRVNFKDPEAGTYKKFTIARRDRYVGLDMPRVLDELNALEDTSDGLKWGGQENILGSPQGRSSALSIDEVTEVVKRNLW